MNKKVKQLARKSALSYKAKENGYEIAIATGRSPFMIAGLLEELDIHTYVTFNGQYVVHNGEVIYTGGVPVETLHKIIAFGESRHEPVVFLDEHRMIASVENHKGILESIQSLKFPYPEVDASFYKYNAVYQTLVFVEEHHEHLYRTHFPEVDFVRWHKYSCDVLPKGGSKAKGIQLLLERIGKTAHDVIVFGDGLNDIEMLQLAGVSVAMDNGHEEVKKLATYVTSHVDEDGLAKAMRKLKLI